MGELHIKGKDLLEGFQASADLSFTDLSTDELLRRLRKAMDIRMHGMSFSAYVGERSPAAESQLPEAQVRERLAHLRRTPSGSAPSRASTATSTAPGWARRWG